MPHHAPHLARAARRACLALLLLAACDDPGSFRGLALDPPEPAPALRLAAAGGDAFDLAAQRGRVVLLFFGYTRCPDVCPTTLADWARLRTALGDDADGVRFVFVSVDPARDTPADAQRYAARFDPSFVGLVADTAAIERVKAGFRIAAHEEPGHAGHYTVAHSTQTFVVDGEGRLRVLHPLGGTVADLEADVRRLLD